MDLLGIGILLFCIGVLLWKRFYFLSIHRFETENPFILETHQIVHFFVGRARHGQRMTTSIRALRDDCYSFWIQFLWTGSGNVEISTKASGVTITGPHSRSGSPLSYYCLLFETAIPRDRERTIELNYVLEDTELRARPHVSVRGERNRKRITIKAEFPIGTKPSVFFQDRVNNNLRNPRPYTFADGSNIACYRIDKPKPNTVYGITWEMHYIKSLSTRIDDLLPQRMDASTD